MHARMEVSFAQVPKQEASVCKPGATFPTAEPAATLVRATSRMEFRLARRVHAVSCALPLSGTVTALAPMDAKRT
jgi:hypothetical protein